MSYKNRSKEEGLKFELRWKAARWLHETAPPAIATRTKPKAGGQIEAGLDGAYPGPVGKGRFMVESGPDSELPYAVQGPSSEPGDSHAVFVW